MTEDISWTPTLQFRWNKRPEAKPPTFWETTYMGGLKSRRPIGYRLEQLWIGKDQLHIEQEWRPISFTESCEDANPKLLAEDMQFWPVDL